MKISRRRQVLAAGGVAAFAVGFSETAGRLAGKLMGEDKPRHRTAGNAPAPEFSVDRNGNLSVNTAQQVSYTTCLGCTTMCGVRVRTDRATGQVVPLPAGDSLPPPGEVDVLWTVRLPADSGEQAASLARLMQFNPSSLASVYRTCDSRGNCQVIDLQDSAAIPH